MKIDLHNRRALVTGSTAGIGFAITRELAAAGVAVVVNGRTQAAVDRAMSQLRNDVAGASVIGIAADASSAEGCNALIAAEPEIDILVNNVGIFKVQSFFDIEDADWLRMFETNVLSGIRLSRHYAPRMRERGWGRVIFISSESALNIPKDMVHYGDDQCRATGGITRTGRGNGGQRHDGECCAAGSDPQRGRRYLPRADGTAPGQDAR
jgi:NAD(P)-dependent dehydrogenase (short-subunit alcohol dehydrogenase family)